jgi:uncharacterized repeat protein (TIGR03847 family)
MPNLELELNPVEFITIGTVGPKGRRQFYLQAGDGAQTETLAIEKEQAAALVEALQRLLEDLRDRYGNRLSSDSADMARLNMELREPFDARFRVAQMGLGYDEERDLVILVAQELVIASEGEDPSLIQPSVARLWVPRRLMRALSQHSSDVVRQGRADPAQNGRVLYYWT